MKTPRWCGVLMVTLLGAVSQVWAGDHVFDAGFDHRAEGPYSDAEAARFLTQATFGPSLAEIARLRSIGYNAWLADQATLPASHHRPYLEAQAAAGLEVYQNARQEAWWTNAITGPDQLRQRVAFALSELLVVSDQSGAIEGYPIAMANYYDLLVDGAFGNYRNLLENVTLSPVMGHYLSMFKNRKPDLDANIRPDENYAREIMQLFSVGLVRLNANGTVQTSGGQPIPTYDQDTIRGFAHVFTGWNWANCPRDQGGQWWEWEYCPSGPVDWPDPGWDAWWLVPMQAWESYHASAEDKQLLVYPGVALPNGILVGGGTAASDLQAALDNIFNHPNVAPFIARHLIKRLVTSNPSPAYVGRVAATFVNNGLGVRGDLAATVRAVLMDSEARTVPSLASNAGKMREPLLKLSHLWRALDGRADDGRYREWYTDYYLSQAPLRSPTVFNFFLPDYRPPGEMATLGLDGPEFQITTDTSVASVANGLGAKVFYDWRGNGNQQPEDIVVDLGPEVAVASDPVRLVDRYDLLFMNRTMSDFMFTTLVTYLQSLPNTNSGRRQRVQNAVWLIQSSPEYAIER
ncbi:DUF1800 domain-containing protein [Dokdonella immobilis]|uniref:Uncharacterized conserved protein, DUF1800 family n=1 Tax=Dokdonella immobilis TaxID=578942 RepID=A0A1I4V5K2_9GAMM|nr:DUF1800 family protein [Dokdonella immobilis]SFM96486.1 Uncharacterized conserved protein, DUF1800 family [Dokdonella immobilis]